MASAGAAAAAGAKEPRVGFIGAGNMATALVRGLVGQGMLPPSSIWVSSPSGPRKAVVETGVHCCKDNATVAQNSDVIILAVKPYVMQAALESMRGDLRPSTLVVSVAAGISIAQLQGMLSSNGGPHGWRIIRVMPNTPAAIGEGASAMCLGGLASKADADVVSRLFSAVGSVDVVSEPQMDAVTGLSGSGPAFVCMFIEALADGGVASGLPRAVAMGLAVQLVKGAASLVQQTGTHPGALKDAVASPGGTTIAGIHALEKGGFRGLVMDAVVSATKRSEELREAAERSRVQQATAAAAAAAAATKVLSGAGLS